MDAAVYDMWNRIKSLSQKGIDSYHCSNADDVKHINTLANAGYITVSWKTALDAVFCIAGETG